MWKDYWRNCPNFRITSICWFLKLVLEFLLEWSICDACFSYISFLFFSGWCFPSQDGNMTMMHLECCIAAFENVLDRSREAYFLWLLGVTIIRSNGAFLNRDNGSWKALFPSQHYIKSMIYWLRVEKFGKIMSSVMCFVFLILVVMLLRVPTCSSRMAYLPCILANTKCILTIQLWKAKTLNNELWKVSVWNTICITHVDGLVLKTKTHVDYSYLCGAQEVQKKVCCTAIFSSINLSMHKHPSL